MDVISDSVIASLVLGYLRREKCRISYKYFYKQCPHLEVYRQKHKQLCTRYYGLSLVDMLSQYSEILYLVHTRLDELGYFDNKAKNFMDLPKLLSYLLQSTLGVSKSPSPVPSLNTPNESMDFDANILSSVERSATQNLDATPLQTLPGNTLGDAPDQTPRLRTYLHGSEQVDDATQTSQAELDKSKCIEDAVKAFMHVLLSDEGLQEKIASNINEMLTPSADAQGECVVLPASAADSAIRAVSAKTQSDPAFESLVSEILGILPVHDADAKPQPSTSGLLNDAHRSCQEVLQVDTSSGGIQQAGESFASGSNLLKIRQAPVVNFLASGDGDKPYFCVTAPSIIQQQPNQQYVTISEQDILTMPVYLCEQEEKNGERVKTMVPIRKNNENLADFITMYKYDEDYPSEEVIQSTSNEPQDQTISVVHFETLPVNDTRSFPPGTTILMQKETDTRTPEQPTITKVPVPTPRSGNRSHVRTLDFNFQATPAKEHPKPNPIIIEQLSPRNNKAKRNIPGQKSTAKTLFSTKSKDCKSLKPPEPWDSKFRACLANAEATLVGTKTTSSPNENIDSNNSNHSNSEPTVEAPTLRERPHRKAKGKVSSKTPLKGKKKRGDVATTSGAKTGEKSEDKDKDEKGENFVNIININQSPKYRQKCNIDTPRKDAKALTPKQLRETREELELVSEPEKMVLSPSKLNGNKRSLSILCENVSKTPAPAMVTPDAPKFEPPVVPASTSAKRNIVPMLETPNKEIYAYPKTPNICSPANINDTPLTKVFKEHTAGVDIASIPTPKMLLTPSFPFTPYMEATQSPASNRPTDYSTSSSYYQPSDTEQNKSLEVLIQECARLDNKRTEPAPAPEKPSMADQKVYDKLKVLSSNVIARKNLSLINKSGSQSSSSSSASCPSESSSEEELTDEYVSRSNNTIIKCSPGESSKRYSLRSQTPAPPAEEIIDVDASSKSDDDVVHVKINDELKEESDTEVTKPVAKPATMSAKCKINEIVSQTDYVPMLTEEELARRKILEELADKRKRTMAMLKSGSSEKKKSVLSKASTSTNNATTSKASKSPGNAKNATVSNKKRLSVSPKNSPVGKKPAPMKRVLRSASCKLKELDLHLSSSSDSEEEHKVEPLDVVEAELHCSKTNSPVPGDDAETKKSDDDDYPVKDIIERLKALDKSPETEGKLSTASERSKGSKQPSKKRPTAKKKEPAPKVKTPKQPTKSKPKSNEKTTRKPPAKKKTPSKAKTKNAKGKENKVSKDDNDESPEKAIVEEVKPEVASEKVQDDKIEVQGNKNEVPIQDTKQQTKVDDVGINKAKAQDVENIQSAEAQNSENAPPNEAQNDSKIAERKDDKNVVFKGTTGPEAVNLVCTLKQRGIDLMPNPQSSSTPRNDSTEVEDGEIVSDNEISESVVIKDEKLGRCVTVMNTPEDELVFFDIQVFTEAICVVSTTEKPVENRVEPDYSILMTKKVSVTVYDDENDAEVEKDLSITPFDCVFDYPSQVEAPTRMKEPVKVLSNVVVVKKERPLSLLYKDMMGDESPTSSNAKTKSTKNATSTCTEFVTRSPLEDMYETPPRNTNRFRKPGDLRNAVVKKNSEKSNSDTSSRSDKQSADLPQEEPPNANEKDDKQEGQTDENQDKKRKLESPENVGDTQKKLKINEDDQKLLKTVNVDNFLENLYK